MLLGTFAKRWGLPSVSSSGATNSIANFISLAGRAWVPQQGIIINCLWLQTAKLEGVAHLPSLLLSNLRVTYMMKFVFRV